MQNSAAFMHKIKFSISLLHELTELRNNYFSQLYQFIYRTVSSVTAGCPFNLSNSYKIAPCKTTAFNENILLPCYSEQQDLMAHISRYSLNMAFRQPNRISRRWQRIQYYFDCNPAHAPAPTSVWIRTTVSNSSAFFLFLNCLCLATCLQTSGDCHSCIW